MMPLYEYICSCGRKIDRLRPITETSPPLSDCCNHPMRRLIAAPHLARPVRSLPEGRRWPGSWSQVARGDVSVTTAWAHRIERDLKQLERDPEYGGDPARPMADLQAPYLGPRAGGVGNAARPIP
jgi:hypothetical protein